MIRFRDLSKAFGDKVVLDGFSLEVPEGLTTALIGYSGTGKSVALKHIVGLLEPDAGSVEVDGKIVHQLSRAELKLLRASIGYVFQFAALLDSLTVFENVALGLRYQGMEQDEIDTRVAACLERVGLEDSGARYPNELSGGMRKRAGIARAIVLRPRYILYDEPTTGLDPVTAAVIDELITQTQRSSGVTGLLVTHDLRSAFSVAQRIAMIFHGKIQAVGSVDEIRNSSDPVVRQFIEGRP